MSPLHGHSDDTPHVVIHGVLNLVDGSRYVTLLFKRLADRTADIDDIVSSLINPHFSSKYPGLNLYRQMHHVIRQCPSFALIAEICEHFSKETC
jgi:hypothetical protein